MAIPPQQIMPAIYIFIDGIHAARVTTIPKSYRYITTRDTPGIKNYGIITAADRFMKKASRSSETGSL
jgi:hypothetical protein